MNVICIGHVYTLLMLFFNHAYPMKGKQRAGLVIRLSAIKFLFHKSTAMLRLVGSPNDYYCHYHLWLVGKWTVKNYFGYICDFIEFGFVVSYSEAVTMTTLSPFLSPLSLSLICWDDENIRMQKNGSRLFLNRYGCFSGGRSSQLSSLIFVWHFRYSLGTSGISTDKLIRTEIGLIGAESHSFLEW